MRFFAACIMMCGAGLAQEAQDPPKKSQDDKKIPEMVITGSKPKDVFDQAYPADIVTGNETGRRLPKSMPDMLKELPGVSSQKTGPAQGSPFIRGWSGYRNLLLIDGVRLNNSVFREGPNQYWGTVDAFIIDRLELIRGPASILYGSDAIGGTVYAHTIEPQFEEGTHLHTRSFYRYAGAEDSHIARQEFSGNTGDFGWVLGGTYGDYGDLSGGRRYGNMKGTAFDQYNADLKCVFKVSENAKLVLATQHHRTGESPRWHSTIDSRSWHGTLPGTDLERDFDQGRNLTYLQYHWAAQGGFLDSVKASLSWHTQTEKEDRTTTTQVEVNEFDVNTAGTFLQLGKKTGLGHFTLGAEFYRDRVGSDAHFRSAGGIQEFERGPVADDATYDQMGVYLQDEIAFGSVDVIPGIRYTRARVDADQVDNIEGDGFVIDPIKDTYKAVTGSLRMVVHVTENWNAIAGWGMGFRAPSLNDTTSFRLQLNQAFDVPTEGLDPEEFHTFDLGVRAKYPTFGMSAFGFYTIIDEFIGRVPTAIPPGAPAGVTSAFAKDNLGEGWVYGFEVSLWYQLLEEVQVFADWGYARGRVDQIKSTAAPFEVDDDPIGKIGPNTVRLGVRYEPKNSKVWVEGLVTVADRQSHLAFQEGLAGGAGDGQRIPIKHGTPGYTVYTLRGGYEISEHVTTTVAVENISDKDYRVHGSGQNEPGTNFVLGVDVRF